MSLDIHQYNSRFMALVFLLGSLSFMPLVCSSILSLLVYSYGDMLEGFALWQWTILFSIAILTMTFALTPTTLVALISGYFLGMTAIVPIAVSYSLASMLGFVLVKVFGHAEVWMVLNQYPKTKRVLNNIHRNQMMTVMLSRLSPALPFALMNVVLSLSGIRFWPFMIGGFLGMLPRTLFFVWIGSNAPILVEAVDHSPSWAWVVIVSIIVFSAFYYLLFRPNQRTP